MAFPNIGELAQFSVERFVSRPVFSTERAAVAVLAFQPGQRLPPHHHDTQDEIYFVFEGTGVMRCGDEEGPVEPGSLVCVPATVVHSVANTGKGDMVVLSVKAPRV